jgi:hypothetical protein
MGNSMGSVNIFTRDNEKYYATFGEVTKKYPGCGAVTAIDIHPLKPEFVVLGFEKGQIALVDIVSNPKASLKFIKEHNRSETPITNIKFCDWEGHSGPSLLGGVGVAKDNKEGSKTQTAWMMVSIDAYGMVVITSVVKVLFVYKVTRHEVINPLTSLYPQFFTMSARFKSLV